MDEKYFYHTDSDTNTINEYVFDKVNGDIVFTSDDERELVKTLARFPEKVLEALEAYEPSIVTRYILDVATAFNRFYHNCQILSASNESVLNTRIELTKAANYVLGNAFDLICLKKTKKI